MYLKNEKYPDRCASLLTRLQIMRTFFLAILSCYSFTVFGQVDLTKPFKDCNVNGSTSIYDYNKQKWIISDTADSRKETLPAFTYSRLLEMNRPWHLYLGSMKSEFQVINDITFPVL